MSIQVSLTDVEAAAKRLKPVARVTPLLTNSRLDESLGLHVLLKAETLQHQGCFKFRGAWNCLDTASSSQLANGVVAWSSGNHAQGVALAAKLKGCSATIVMPSDAPRRKRDSTIALGASIHPYDRATEDREEIGRQLATGRGALLVPSYDHPAVIAGQGTVGLEMAAQCAAMDVTPDAAVICCGGGGLAAGSAIALRSRYPQCSIFTAEPEGLDDTARSLASGRREENSAHAASICDALLTPKPGEQTLPLLRSVGAQGLVASDDDVRATMRIAMLELGLVLEPGGAIALAAVRRYRERFQGQTILVTLSGANVDPDLLRIVLDGE